MPSTEALFSTLDAEVESGGAGGQTSYASLLKLDDAWARLRAGEAAPPRQVVFEDFSAAAALSSVEYDVAVCGGNLGILLAAALQLRGLRVCVVEAGELRGRAQDWNASRKELEELLRLGVLREDELDEVIGIEFNPMRVGFVGMEDLWVTDVLNVGIRPVPLLARARSRFEAAGGVVLDRSPLSAVTVVEGGVRVSMAGGAELSAALLLDCMGQRSPIVAQQRAGAAPDGACIVVGTCASGYDEETNVFGDIIFSDQLTDVAGASNCPTQYFWESFPASSGPADRTTYLFTYLDLHPSRPSVSEIFDDYWRLLPSYQGISLEELKLRRALFGLFVSYKDSPLRAGFDRVLQVGDASGVQSPLSFGGFGALMRHLPRLTDGISSAVRAKAVRQSDLALLNLYQPNLRSAWLFQAAMRPPPAGAPSWEAGFISRVLAATFEAMTASGDSVMRPFLQDVLRVDGLALTIGGLMLTSPLVAIEIVFRLGPLAIADWSVHFAAMLAYSLLASPPVATALLAAQRTSPPRRAFALQELSNVWKYGAGFDFEQLTPPTPLPPAMRERARGAAAAMRSAANTTGT